jgi:hypothetical protein
MDDTSKEIEELERIQQAISSSDEKSLKEWFKEKWVDISRPKPGGGFEECGRDDADKGKYPKCVPASRAARMSKEEIASAVRRKRTAESKRKRVGKLPIYVSTDKKQIVSDDFEVKAAEPTNRELYERVKSEAKQKFDVYPSAYANAWLVREYKKRGGKYRQSSKGENMSTDKQVPQWATSGIRIPLQNEDRDEIYLVPEEKELAVALVRIAGKYGRFNQDGSGIWAGYESAKENQVSKIGVKCENCVLYLGGSQCRIIEMPVQPEGKCRFAIIPDGVVTEGM